MPTAFATLFLGVSRARPMMASKALPGLERRDSDDGSFCRLVVLTGGVCVSFSFY
jgi:hypothetical protein